MFLVLSAIFKKWFPSNMKTYGTNCLCILFLIGYSAIGGFVFLYLEKELAEENKSNITEYQLKCIKETLEKRERFLYDFNSSAEDIFERCVQQLLVTHDERMQWNLLNSVLYSFGIITTLGYGKLEPNSTAGRICAVIYGFIGIPITVIIFSSFGKRSRRNSINDYHKDGVIEFTDNENEDYELQSDKVEEDLYQPISALSLVNFVVFYLLIGSFICSELTNRFDFWNGIYFSFLCFTAIEYGELIPENPLYIPIIVVYISVGLALSTTALDVGSLYVRKLYFVGKKLTNMANVQIWFGSEKIQLKELLGAIGQNIGMGPNALWDNIDIDGVVNYALLVKEGKLDAVPQGYAIMEGVWPPELIPLFLKDNYVPKYVDDDEKSMMSVSINSNNLPESNIIGGKRNDLVFHQLPPISPNHFKKVGLGGLGPIKLRSSFKTDSIDHRRAMSVRFKESVTVQPVEIEKKEDPYKDIHDIDED
ncbi:Potassium channel subfamily K member 18 [Strongyloides ratti]|uniref:Potassium channel subfamily K member 18 n=1 Tax=Strongyloides ratti TaxID=34506 RepID=A0A090LEW6_STRRB|nr:Potassium channel subfamily K member 18 [Strongyloides ratti]CEF68331.1 Potassium channel subfamily K member 18 [Strongyloides ratti]